MPLIGMCGAHRTGKTTLCRELEENYGVHFIQTNVSTVLADCGVTPGSLINLPFLDFCHVQTIVLEHLGTIAADLASDKTRCYVVDRTVIDALAYFRQYFNSKFFYELDAERNHFERVALQYVETALEVSSIYDHLVLVQPGIQLVQESGKAVNDLFYINQINTSILGDLTYLTQAMPYRTDWITIVPPSMINLSERSSFLYKMVINKLTNFGDLHVRPDQYN